MATETIEALVDGGKASAGPPLGPALGPAGVNIGQVISAINEKTASFKGMQVPIKVIVDTDTKEFDIKVGTPPASALIKKEAGIEKGSGNPLRDKVADLKIEQVIKVSKMKEDDVAGRTTKARVKEIIGTCNSMGVMVEGVSAKEAMQRVDAGEFDEKIKAEKTELTAEELKHLADEKQRLKKELEERREEFTRITKETVEKNSSKSRSQLKTMLNELKIPAEIYEPLLPADKAAAPKK